ncbi:MAG: hypothetical protein FWC22_00085 [Treponema sp.]|nr:hypothetical protein [Treponema sp.]
MNKRINFEDTVFIVIVRIKMIRDLMHLDTDINIFYSQTMGDLEFIGSVMNMLSAKFLENIKFLDREAEADSILDAEWQFGQLLNEISNNSSPFSSEFFPEMPAIISKLRKESNKRRNQIEESYVPPENSIPEPIVGHAELNGLLGSA